MTRPKVEIMAQTVREGGESQYEQAGESPATECSDHCPAALIVSARQAIPARSEIAFIARFVADLGIGETADGGDVKNANGRSGRTRPRPLA